MLPKLRLQPDPSAAGFAHDASATGNLTMPFGGLIPYWVKDIKVGFAKASTPHSQDRFDQNNARAPSSY